MTAPSPLAPIAFLAQTVLAQVIALGSAILVWECTESGAATVTVATAIAVAGARFLRLPMAWTIVNLLLPLSISATFAVSLPSWLFAVPFAALAAVHTPALWTRVPYYPTSRAAYPLILAELPPDEPFTFIDIGCGCGDLLIFLRKHRPLGRYYGVEIGLFPYMVSQLKAQILGKGSIAINFRNINRTPLHEFDYVYAFLSPAVMTKVWQKAYREMKPGSTFITNSFEAPATAVYVIPVKDTRGSSLFVHRMAEERGDQVSLRTS